MSTPAAASKLPLKSRVTWRWRILSAAPPAQHRLRSRLLVLMLLATAPLVAAVLFDGLATTKSEIAMRQQRMHDNASSLVVAVDREFDTALASIAVMANETEPGNQGQTAGYQALLNQIARSNAAFLALRHPDGRLILRSADSGVEEVRDDRMQDWRGQALAAMHPVFGNVVFTEPSHIAVVPIIQPIGHSATARATLELLLPVDRLSATLRRSGIAHDNVAVLTDAAGRVGAASQASNTLIGHPPPDIAPSSAVASLHRVPGWQVTVQEDPLIATPIPYMPLLRAALGCVVGLGLGLAMMSLFSRRLTDWLQSLSTMARNVAVGGEWGHDVPDRLPVMEFEELRSNLARADAVLRRRSAAERMALREARTGHELLVSVVNGTAESIHVKDLDLRYVLVNHAALQAGAEPRAEWQVLGKQTADLFPRELAARIEAADRRVLASGQSTSFEQEYLANGETAPRWIAMTVAPWQDAEGHVVGVVSVSRDVTPHRQAQVRLRKLQAELLRATRLSAMGAMASGLAHELNQPLAAATNYLNASNRLLERGDRGDLVALGAARGAVSDAAQQMLRAGAIVRRLRDFVERGEVELQPELVGELLRETCDLATSDGLPNGIELALEVDDGLGRVLVDRTQIGQVLLNLLRNAGEAIQSADLPRPGRILVSAAMTEFGMRIAVQDNGPGLAPDIADRLFEPFVSSKRTGMGIGLSICRTIVEGHGGKLTAETADDGGMIFRILLPVLLPQGEIA